MNRDNFTYLKHFAIREVEATGAQIQDVQAELMSRLDQFRELVGCSVRLLQNGMTTGIHKSRAHKKGLAADVALEDDGELIGVLWAAFMAGFRGFGTYWNGRVRSYHLEICDVPRGWNGKKDKPGRGAWKYGKLLNDPKGA